MSDETQIPDRFPKVASPYHRSEDANGNYTIDPYSVKGKFDWVFDRADEVQAIEKLDGTNMAVYVERQNPEDSESHSQSPIASEHKHGEWAVTDAATRMGNRQMNRVHPLGPTTNHHYLTRAIQNSIRRGYIDLIADEYGSGWFFGEGIGPKFQGNPHGVDEHLFVPFDWMRDHLEYKSYGDYSTKYDALRDWFRGEENGLFSLFASRMHGQDLEASRPENGTFVEGLIFVHPDFDGRITPFDLTTGDNGKVQELAKVRRDMFSEYYTEDWPMNETRH